MKAYTKSSLTCLGASIALLTTPAQSALVVYESFDYAAGALAGSNTGTGWGGAWSTAVAPGVGNTNVHDVAASGLTFGTLSETGNSTDRGIRNGRSAASRTLSGTAISDLTTDGTTVYFSVLMNVSNSPGQTQAANSYATLMFGSEQLVDAGTVNNNGNGTILQSAGDGVGVGFFGVQGGAADYSQNGLQGVSFDNSTAPTHGNGGVNSVVTGAGTNFVVGEIIWAADGTDDVINLYWSNDPNSTTPLALFSTQSLDVSQGTFDTIPTADGQASVIDEIRFGTDLASVAPGLTVTIPEPTALSLFGLSALALLRRRRA